MASSGRRADYGEEFVERLRKDRFRKAKAYILVNGVSSEEEDEELCFDEEDDEIASYAMDPPTGRPASVHSSRRPPSVAATSFSKRHQRGGPGAYGFDAQDLYYFGMVSELNDKFTPESVSRLVGRNPPPAEFRSLLVSVERIAYLLYYSLYGRYLSVNKFHHVFNREFYKYTSAGHSERAAFLKICRHTLEEYKRRAIERNKQAYKMSQKHLFSDERATPDSRLSDRPSMEESEDLNSVDSLAKELMFYRAPHMPVRFGPGGRIIFVNPDSGVSTVCIQDVKHFYKEPGSRRYVEMLESFKGPMLVGHTPPQTPLLFIQCQIDRILRSDVYRANPASGDANDCLLIWSLLEMLIRQHGKVTGPDLARLLCANQPHPPVSAHSFLKSGPALRGPSSRSSPLSRQDSADPNSDSAAALDRVTRFLLGGHVDEAVESAISDGLLFDALLLAHRLFRNDQRRLETVEARLMAHRSAQHPVTTLLSVAAGHPVPLLSNPTSYDTNGWRSHIAIVLANLQSPTAMNAVFHLGLALAQKEFNSAADFCFLAVNLLTGHDCFQQQPSELDAHGESTGHRKHIGLINASLPDDEAHSCATRFGWQLLDYQATELFDYALRLANPNPNSTTVVSNSVSYRQARQQYAQLLDELGGFGYAVELYRTPVGGQNEANDRTAKVAENKEPKFVWNSQLNHADQGQTRDRHQQEEPATPPAPAMQTHHTAPAVPTTYPAPAMQAHQHPAPVMPTKNTAPAMATKYSAPVIPAYNYNHRQSTGQEHSQKEPTSPHSTSYRQRTESELTDEDEEEEEDGEDELTPPPFIPTFPPIPQPPQQPPSAQSRSVSPPAPVVHQQQHQPAAPAYFPQLPTSSVGAGPAPPPLQATVPSPVAVVPTFPAPTANEQQPQMSKIPKGQQMQNKKETKEEKNNGGAKGKGGGGGFLSGFLSKIKPPAGQNEMRLPEDKNPKIVWDSQLGRYVDQDQPEAAQEELAPPPIMPLAQQPFSLVDQQQSQSRSASPPAAVQQQQLPQQPLAFFPQMPAVSADSSAPAQSSTASGAGRPFQGRARYANAWNS